MDGGLNTYGYVYANPISLIDPYGLDGMLTVTTPDGATYLPVTTVKNNAQAKELGVPKGSIVPIIVPTLPKGQSPQDLVNLFREPWPGPGSEHITFGLFWRPHGPHDYKFIHPMYDAYGNFEYGATGQASGYECHTLTNVANALHFFHNSKINTTDIESGYNAISNGGTLGVVNGNPFISKGP